MSTTAKQTKQIDPIERAAALMEALEHANDDLVSVYEEGAPNPPAQEDEESAGESEAAQQPAESESVAEQPAACPD